MERKVDGIDNMPSPYNKGAINIEELVSIRPDIVFLRADILQVREHCRSRCCKLPDARTSFVHQRNCGLTAIAS